MDSLLSAPGALALYFLCCASAALLLRAATPIPDEVFRKLLHTILLGSLWVWVRVFDAWQRAAAAAVVFALAVYPLLWLAERLRGYSRFVTERSGGELKSSLLLVFFMFAGVVTICWGLFGERLLVLAVVYAWGVGDAAAALVGKRFGRRRLYGKKTLEGSAAMLLCSFSSVLAVLTLRGGLSLPLLLLISALTAAVTAAAELFTTGGLDTVTCPLAALCTLLPLLHWAQRI